MRRTMYDHLDWICLIIYAMPTSHDKPWEIKKGLLLQLKALVESSKNQNDIKSDLESKPYSSTLSSQ